MGHCEKNFALGACLVPGVSPGGPLLHIPDPQVSRVPPRTRPKTARKYIYHPCDKRALIEHVADHICAGAHQPSQHKCATCVTSTHL